MRLRHSETFASAVLWLMMLPPFSKGVIRVDAPLRQWRLTLHVFDSVKDCEEERHAKIRELSAPRRDPENSLFRSAPGIFETGYEQAICVSSEDPRLQSKRPSP
jgi:hypothetical protein